MNYGTPSPDYLAQIGQTFGGAPPAAVGTPMPTVTGPPVAPPLDVPPPMDGPQMSVQPPPGPTQSVAPPPAPVATPAAPEGPQSFLQQVARAGAVNVPAHETEMRGPHFLAAQDERNKAYEGAIQAVTERTQQTAAGDFALALEQEHKARVREDAANYAAAQHNDEMIQRQADFDQSVKAMSQVATQDPSRFWSNASAGQKFALMVSIGLGALGDIKTGKGNPGVDMANRLVEQDLKAQEFAYHAARDTANAKQTAFSMAMQKYNNADAARAAVRAAAMDIAQAQVAKQSAMWKTTEAQNRGTMSMAAYMDERANQVAQGIAFAPAHQVATQAQYVDTRTGLPYDLPGARRLAETDLATQEKRHEKGVDVAGQLLVEGAKAGAHSQDKSDDGAKFVSSQLQQAGIPQARAAAERALKALNKSEGGMGEAFVRGAVGDTVVNKASDERAEREQAYADFTNTAIKATMGNATESEVGRAMKGLGSISNPAARRRAIEAKLKEMDAIEKNARAGATSAAQQDFSKRRQEAEGGPATAPTGSKAGW